MADSAAALLEPSRLQRSEFFLLLKPRLRDGIWNVDSRTRHTFPKFRQLWVGYASCPTVHTYICYICYFVCHGEDQKVLRRVILHRISAAVSLSITMGSCRNWQPITTFLARTDGEIDGNCAASVRKTCHRGLARALWFRRRVTDIVPHASEFKRRVKALCHVHRGFRRSVADVVWWRRTFHQG